MYWLTAKHQTYLGNGIQIEKGQQFMLNINTMGAKPSFIPNRSLETCILLISNCGH